MLCPDTSRGFVRQSSAGTKAAQLSRPGPDRAVDHGVTTACIGQIARGETWRHVNIDESKTEEDDGTDSS